jgi:hypothetical protein
MAAKPTIQLGSKAFGTNTSITIARGTDSGFDTTVTTTKTILLWSLRGTGGIADAAVPVRGVLTDGDTITFDRTGTTTGLTVDWQLVTFATGVVVQHVASTIATSTSSKTETINAASIGGARFIVPGGQLHTGVAVSGYAFVRWRITSSTQVEVSRASAGVETTTASCQVVEWDTATVEPVDWSVVATSTSTTADKTITAVDLDTTFVVGSGFHSNNGFTNGTWVPTLENTTTLRLTRVGTGSGNLSATMYVVTIPTGLNVQRPAAALTGVASLDVDITAVTTADTALFLASTGLWSSGANASSNFNRYPGSVTFVDTDTIRIQKNSTDNVTFAPQVLEFVQVGPTITVQPVADTVILSNETSASFSVTATGTGTLLYDWELEDGVGSGVYANLANGNGATWTGQASASCSATLTAKTLTGRRVRCNVTDDNGTTTSSAVALTIWDGPQVTTFPATNGSGVSTATLTSDYVTGVGEAIEVRIPLSDGDVAVTVTTT